MRIAIVHDYIKEYGGAERVLEELHKMYPDAPIYTSIFAPEYLGPHVWNFRQMDIRTSFLQYIPFKEKLISIFRLISPLAFYSFDLSSYDVVIVSQTGAYFPNMIRKGPSTSSGSSTKLICYTHTPPRYLYGYMTAREIKNVFVKALSAIVFHILRMVDFKASQNVDYFVTNSQEVRARIQKFYRRDSTVINPPVSLPSTDYRLQQKKAVDRRPSTVRNYYLAGGRLARAKGIDIIVEAFNENGRKLKVFGKGFAGFDEELRAMAGKNIEFLGEVTDHERQELMGNAKAYLFASYDEDFGITPVEAMSVGTPVIAYRNGGVKETVVDGKTGIFFDENTPEAINNAIKRFEKMKISSDTCRKRAQQFSSEIFDKKIKEFIKKYA